jgi:1,4-dihydroxy-2-naphthoyl-CoA synthase
VAGHLRTDDRHGIRMLTIDRPESKNALHAALRSELCAAVVAADSDDAVRVVLLTAVDPVFPPVSTTNNSNAAPGRRTAQRTSTRPRRFAPSTGQ